MKQAPEAIENAAKPIVWSIAGTDSGGGAVLVGYGTGGEATSRRRRPAAAPAVSSAGVMAKPPIRKLAKDLGVALIDVTGTGKDGEVKREDVLAFAEQASVFRNRETPQWGDVREETISVSPEVAALQRRRHG